MEFLASLELVSPIDKFELGVRREVIEIGNTLPMTTEYWENTVSLISNTSG